MTDDDLTAIECDPPRATDNDVLDLVAEIRRLLVENDRLRALPDDAMQIATAVRDACDCTPASDADLTEIVRRVRGAR